MSKTFRYELDLSPLPPLTEAQRAELRALTLASLGVAAGMSRTIPPKYTGCASGHR